MSIQILKKQLIKSCRDNDLNTVHEILTKYSSFINTSYDPEHRTPLLHLATQQNFIELFDLLILHHADINALDTLKFNALYYACQNSHSAIMHKILNHPQLSGINFSTLYTANPNNIYRLIISNLENHNFSMVKELLPYCPNTDHLITDSMQKYLFTCKTNISFNTNQVIDIFNYMFDYMSSLSLVQMNDAQFIKLSTHLLHNFVKNYAHFEIAPTLHQQVTAIRKKFDQFIAEINEFTLANMLSFQIIASNQQKYDLPELPPEIIALIFPTAKFYKEWYKSELSQFSILFANNSTNAISYNMNKLSSISLNHDKFQSIISPITEDSFVQRNIDGAVNYSSLEYL